MCKLFFRDSNSFLIDFTYLSVGSKSNFFVKSSIRNDCIYLLIIIIGVHNYNGIAFIYPSDSKGLILFQFRK